jgi:hypothetical protein
MTRESFGNVAFFPAYPLLGRAVSRTLGIPTPISLLLVAQTACVGFWTYFLLLGRLWGVPPRTLAVGAALVAVHPGAFFLVASYSEALFLCGLLGFVFWTESELPGSATLAAGHGFLMTATRLVGAPLAAYPLLRVWLRPNGGFAQRLRRSDVPLLVGIVASLGALSFLGYCAVRFGRWNVYFETERIGWNVHPDYWAIFYPKAYLPLPSYTVTGGLFDAEHIGLLSVPVLMALLVGIAVWQWRSARRGDPGWQARVPLWLCALLLVYVPLAGHYTRFTGSHTRFSLCPFTLLVLLGMRLAGTRKWPRWVWLALAVWLVTMLGLQIAFTYRYTHGRWVA